MNEQVKLERRKKITKIILVTVTVLFIFVMLVVPLFSVMASALKEGLGFYKLSPQATCCQHLG